MGATSLTREQLNEAINEFADKIMETLGATVAAEETTEPELTGTRFKAININGDVRVMDAMSISGGTLIVVDVYEYFRCYGTGDECHPWVRYTGRTFTNEEFAQEMRDADTLPRVIHEG